MARSNVLKKKSGAAAADPKAWTTPDQREYLNSQRGDYTNAQSQRGAEAKKIFWALVFKHWQETWPFPELTADEKEAGVDEESRLVKLKEVGRKCKNIHETQTHTELQRIKQWFNNHTRASASSGGRRKLLKLGGTKKKLRTTQAYQTLYYQEKIKEVVEKRWEIEYKSKPGNESKVKCPAPPLHFRNQITEEMWENESAEVKAKVEEYRNKSEESDDELGEEADGEVDAEELKRRAKAKHLQA